MPRFPTKAAPRLGDRRQQRASPLESSAATRSQHLWPAAGPRGRRQSRSSRSPECTPTTCCPRPATTRSAASSTPSPTSPTSTTATPRFRRSATRRTSGRSSGCSVAGGRSGSRESASTPVARVREARASISRRSRDRFSLQWRVRPQGHRQAVMQHILDSSGTTLGMTVAGPRAHRSREVPSAPAAPGGPGTALQRLAGRATAVLRACTHFTEEKWPWPTRTGRQQFYVDHPWFLQAGRERCRPTSRARRPEATCRSSSISCHARWSIHSIWRDDPMLLRLQRGEPALYLNPRDAEQLGIADGDWAELENRLRAGVHAREVLVDGPAARRLLLPRLGAAPVPEAPELQVR